MIVVLCCLVLFPSWQSAAQVRAQDSTLNNLVLPPGYETCKLGELGEVKKEGNGPASMILVAGLGFGGTVFDPFVKQYEDHYTVYTVTPAGFGGTHAPPMPDTSVSFSAATWTNGIVTGIVNLIKKEKLQKPVIVAHFVTGTQVALNLALYYPDLVGKVVIMGGSPYRYYASRGKNREWDWDIESKYTPEVRSALVKQFWSPKWFKTVTKRTWDGNMWSPEDYARDTTAGKEFYTMSSAVPLPVMIRYLEEWMAYDVSGRYKEIRVPLLVLIPDFDGLSLAFDPTRIANPANRSKVYLKYFHQDPVWQQAVDSGNPYIAVKTIPGTRLFMWDDNPAGTYKAIDEFLR